MRPDPTPSVFLADGPADPPGASASALAARDVDLVVNANATGAGSTADVVARATDALERAGAHVRAHVTGTETELAAVAATAAGRRFVLVGGDGTVHALANVDLPTLPATALLPAGRANNIARALGIPVDWGTAAQLAVHGRPAAVDALRVETPQRTLYAVEGVSAGFHAAARHRYTATNSGDLAAGVRALVAELATFRPHRVALDVDGATAFDGTAAQVFLSNLPYFGFGFHVDPAADPSDGRLEAIVLEGTTRRDVVRLLSAARDGRHLGRPGVTLTRATEARTERPLPLVADAVPLGVTTAVVTVAPGRLTLVVQEPRS
jgi:diacylglycerol kinase (ATP)